MTKTLLLLVILIGSCTPPVVRNDVLKNGWGYQLQYYNFPYDLKRIADSKQKLWVIDYSKDGTDKGSFQQREISELKKNGKAILSYMSIGEAESYRFYFKTMPKSLLLHENKKWKGNFPVKYWDQRWQQIIDLYIDKILERGFDGVYLDIVDAFENIDPMIYSKKEAALRMSDFIKRISKRLKRKDPRKLVFIQNGIHIIKHLDDEEAFFTAIDGAALEAVLFQYDSEINITYQLSQIEDTLEQFRNYHKTLLSIEYIEARDTSLYIKRAKQYRLTPLIGKRPLSGRLKFIY